MSKETEKFVKNIIEKKSDKETKESLRQILKKKVLNRINKTED